MMSLGQGAALLRHRVSLHGSRGPLAVTPWLLAVPVLFGVLCAPANAALCVTGWCSTWAQAAPAALTPDTATLIAKLGDPITQAQAFAQLTDRANDGDVAAMVRLGTVYLNGEFGAGTNKSLAATLFDRAAAKGDTVASIQLALLLLDGTSMPPDVSKAVKLLQAAAKTGDVWSTTILAGLYTKGDKIAADGNTALRLLQPLVDKNIGAALTAMGDVYAVGAAPVARDPVRARGLFERGVALGDIGAKSRLGTILTGGEGSAADVTRGLQLLEDVAKAGDGWTLIQIGNLHAAGKVVPLNAELALLYYGRAAAGGLAPALSLMGNLYNTGLGTIARDPAHAAQLYEQAVAARDNTARVQLSLMLLAGTSLPADVPRAIGLLTDAAETGDVWSAVVLAGLYTDGKQVAPDGTLAEKLLQPLVAAKQPAAITALGDVYAKGPVPVAADPAKARTLFEQAVALGDTGAKSRLGTILTDGQDIGADVPRGLSLLEDVAAAGDGWTLVQLGNLYSAGKVVPLDADKALDYYNRAAGAGIAPALALMGNVYSTGLGAVDRDLRHAASFYEQAVADKDNTGRVQLSLMLLDGEGVPRDVKRAVGLLGDASATGDLWSTTILATLYADGRMLPPDYGQAKHFSDLATSLGGKDAMLQFGTNLAIGPLSTKHLAEGIALVRAAVVANVPRANLQYGRLLLLGKLNGAMSADAVTVLEKSVATGDAAALRTLLQFYRAGTPGVSKASPAQAQQLLAKHGDLLPRPDRAFETILTAAAGPAAAGRLQGVSAQFEDLRASDVSQIMRVLRWSHPNEFVYVLQQQMAAHALYNGPLDGVLNNSTMKALLRLCRQLNVGAVCAAGPMNAAGVDVIANWVGSVWSPKAEVRPIRKVSLVVRK